MAALPSTLPATAESSRCTTEGSGRAKTNAYIAGSVKNVGADIFQRGVCLPSDIKMTIEEQDKVIEVIQACFE